MRILGIIFRFSSAADAAALSYATLLLKKKAGKPSAHLPLIIYLSCLRSYIFFPEH